MAAQPEVLQTETQYDVVKKYCGEAIQDSSVYGMDMTENQIAVAQK